MDSEGVWWGLFSCSDRIDFVVSSFNEKGVKDILLCHANYSHYPVNNIPSNTPTSYLPDISKQRNRFSGSISPKMDHQKICRK